MTKYIFVTGGVVSGPGQGTLPHLLGRPPVCAAGLKKSAAQKLDPYINADPGNDGRSSTARLHATDDGVED